MFTLCRSVGRLDLKDLRPLPGLVAQNPVQYLGGRRDIKSRLETVAEETLARHGILPPTPDAEGDGHDDIYGTMDTAFDTGFSPEQASLVLRGYRDDPSSMRLTLLVVADWEDGQWTATRWEAAVYDLSYAMGVAMDKLQLGFCVNIEFIATHLIRKAHAFPVTGQPDLESAWNREILPKLTRLASSNTNIRDHINAIALRRIGFKRHNPLDNPLTVYIALDHDCDERHWLGLNGTMTQYLNTLTHQIGLRIEHNRWSLATFLVKPTDKPYNMPRDNEPYQTQASLGADIGSCTHMKSKDGTIFNPYLGTLGCYVELWLPKEKAWKKLALTNYHVVRPLFQGFLMDKAQNHTVKKISPGTALWSVDRKGIGPSTAPSLGEIEHASRVKHNRIMTAQASVISKIKNPEMRQARQEAYNAKKQFFDDNLHVLGKLFAASGFARRSSSGKRLDWALIDVAPERQGSNTLPDILLWELYHRLGEGPDLPVEELQDPHQGSWLSSLKTGDTVWKMGAVTGPTAGTFNGLYTHCGIREAKYVSEEGTMEYVIDARGIAPTPLGAQGDSGSVVYCEDAAAAGLLFRGMPDENAGVHMTIITPIEEVFEDIKALTGATAVRVA